MRRYGALGLLLFVAIPFPGTGAWTGSLLAWLLGLPIVSSALAIILGVVLAGIIVSLISAGLLQMAYVYKVEYILTALVAIALFYTWYRKKKKR